MKALASYTLAFKTGDTIFNEGDPGCTAYIIERGKVEVSISRKGERLVLAQYDTGDLFGEMALIDDTPRSATITVLEPTEVIAIDRSLFEKAFDKAHPLVNLFMHTILYNLRKTNQLLLNKVVTPGYLLSQDKFNNKFLDARNETVYLVKAENELNRALRDDEFELYFQPIVKATTGRVEGFETLIRWFHPERGMVPPGEFITTAEQTGLIKEMGDWIIQEACRQLSRLSNEYPDLLKEQPDFFISINLSAKQFIFPDLFSVVTKSLDTHGLTPKNIKFEITESILMDSPETAMVILEKFKEQGFRIAIDDFGTGYSSLSYLHTFPIDTLKIDRSFVISMLENHTSLNIVNAIVSLANAIDLTIIAEGVETEEQLKALQDLNCDLVQGFYFHKPLPFTDVLELLKPK
ncbi:MAG: EAL domain-containing protein [Gammaproteobacteria bacterium]|nr:EAL domain-containing protein [Gammaproteobacteria bacterium]